MFLIEICSNNQPLWKKEWVLWIVHKMNLVVVFMEWVRFLLLCLNSNGLAVLTGEELVRFYRTTKWIIHYTLLVDTLNEHSIMPILLDSRVRLSKAFFTDYMSCLCLNFKLGWNDDQKFHGLFIVVDLVDQFQKLCLLTVFVYTLNELL